MITEAVGEMKTIIIVKKKKKGGKGQIMREIGFNGLNDYNENRDLVFLLIM